MDIKNIEAVKRSVDAARKSPPASFSSEFLSVRKAKIGSPVIVYTPAGEPASWLVPFLQKDRVCGFAQVDLSLNVGSIGIFGASADDFASWLDASFFEKPPEKYLSEIKKRYPKSIITGQIFSYDKSPSKWGWRLEVKEGNAAQSVIFINPGGWYERPPDTTRTDLEG